jgi:hypothetical protein
VTAIQEIQLKIKPLRSFLGEIRSAGRCIARSPVAQPVNPFFHLEHSVGTYHPLSILGDTQALGHIFERAEMSTSDGSIFGVADLPPVSDARSLQVFCVQKTYQNSAFVQNLIPALLDSRCLQFQVLLIGEREKGECKQ